MTEEQDRFVGEVVATGRFGSAADVVGEGLRLLERREAREAAKTTRFLALVAEGDAAYARGEYEEVPVDGIAAWLASLDADEKAAASD